MDGVRRVLHALPRALPLAIVLADLRCRHRSFPEYPVAVVGDPTGRAEAAFTLTPGALNTVVGSRMDFCAVFGSASSMQLTDVVGFSIVP